MRAVGFRRIEEGDPAVVGCPDERDLLRPIGDRRLVLAAVVLDAQPDAGDLQVAQFAAANRPGCGRAARCRACPPSCAAPADAAKGAATSPFISVRRLFIIYFFSKISLATPMAVTAFGQPE